MLKSCNDDKGMVLLQIQAFPFCKSSAHRAILDCKRVMLKLHRMFPKEASTETPNIC